MISTRNKVEVEHKVLRTDEKIEITKNLIAWLTSQVPVADRSYDTECIEQLYKMLRCVWEGPLQVSMRPNQPSYTIDIDIAAQVLPGSYVYFPASFRVMP